MLGIRIISCLAAGLVLSLAGCTERADPRAHREDAATKKKPPQLKVLGYATLQGRVTYKGKEPPAVTKIKPKFDPDKFPAEVPGAGWYVDEKNQGVQYALVFLKPPPGHKMPVLVNADKLPVDSNGQVIESVQIGSPKGQFHPRVVALHPRQKLEIINNSDPPVNCDAHVRAGRNAFSTVFRPGDKVVWDLEPDNNEPNVVAGSVYSWKTAYAWKMTHPYAVLTDAEGKFELKHVPILEDDQKLTVWVWHEMLPGDHSKEIGLLELEAGKTLAKDVVIPGDQ